MSYKHFSIFRYITGRKRLTIQEKEAIIDAVLKQNAASTRRPAHKRSPLFAKMAVLVTLVLGVPLAILLLYSDHGDNGGRFLTRGDEATEPLFSIRCLETGGNRCRRGDTLIMEVSPPKMRPYIAAFAANPSNESVIWYFPSKARETSIPVNENSYDGVLNKGIRIGKEHLKGEYLVYCIFSDRPLTRNEIRDLIEKKAIPKRCAYSILERALYIK